VIRALIRLDLALLLRSKAAWLLVILLVVTSALALSSGLDWRDRYLGAASSAREQVQKDAKVLSDVYDDVTASRRQPTNVATFDGNGEFIPDPRDPYVAGFYHTQLAELPAGPLLGLATGSTELRATYHLLKTVPLSSLMRVGQPAERVNPGALAAGRFDLLAFILYLSPLALALLLFDAIARERESGIAPVVASMGAGRRDLLIARGITRGGLVVLIAVFASLIGIALVGAIGTTAAAWWIATTLAYLLMWTMLLLWVASIGLSAVGSAAAGVAMWVGLMLLSPGLIERMVRPDGLLEPRALAEANVRTAVREASADDAAKAEAKARVARDYWMIDFTTAPACANREGVLGEYVERRISDETYSAAMRQGAAREALYDARLDRWGWLSPSLAIRRSMEALAGVDPTRQRAFEAQVIDYHATLRNRVTDALFACRGFDRAAFDATPKFGWRAPEGAITVWLGLGAALVVALFAALFALRRRRLFD
jgi:ABC-2 type transport system permease protein